MRCFDAVIKTFLIDSYEEKIRYIYIIRKVKALVNVEHIFDYTMHI